MPTFSQTNIMLFIKFTTTQNFNSGKTILEGYSVFDTYKSENALKFFSLGSITNAALTLRSAGFTEGTDFTFID